MQEPGIRKLVAHRRNGLSSADGMSLHHFELFRGQPSWFQKDAVGDRHFANVMQWTSLINQLNVVVINDLPKLRVQFHLSSE